MIDDIRKSKTNYNHFIKESMCQLKKYNFCYVYNKEQLDEMLQRLDADVIVEENDCGYTIKMKRC